MKLQVRLFAVARQLAGHESIELELSEPATIGAIRQELRNRIPELSTLMNHLLFAVNAEYAGDETLVTVDCDVACIPPVSGG
jgi:molybdopterin converting factor small subunit